MIDFLNNEKCMGCSACVNICPTQCLSLKKNKEGFLYPEITGNCISCGKCEKTCPIINKHIEESSYKQKAYALCTKSKRIWKQSSSGGAYSEICKAVDDGKTLFVGATWDNLSVVQKGCVGYKQIKQFRKSKYIASDPKDSYKIIKEYLERGNKVVYCSTPCYVAGLRSFLGKDYPNLLCVDFICHGVGSPLVFNLCLKEIENVYAKKVKNFEFRAKRDIYETDHLTKITFNDGKSKYLINDIYSQLFLKQICLRKSCGENCAFRNSNRQGDLTIADFKNLTGVFERFIGYKQNFSTLVVNNEKGANIVEKMKHSTKMIEVEIDVIKQNNPLFYRQTWFSNERDEFFSDVENNLMIAKKNMQPMKELKKGIFQKIFSLLPVFLRRKILLKRNRTNGKN